MSDDTRPTPTLSELFGSMPDLNRSLARQAVDALEAYEDTHRPAREGGVCLDAALQAARKALEEAGAWRT